MTDWAAFVAQAPAEEYLPCVRVHRRGGIPPGGAAGQGEQLPLSHRGVRPEPVQPETEFDHFLDGGNYHGLDKFSLDAAFQDNSYLKTALAYDMMAAMAVPTPLWSYAWVTVNGTPWGLFLAVEEPEEAFARRVYGTNLGQLYQPDYGPSRKRTPTWPSGTPGTPWKTTTISSETPSSISPLGTGSGWWGP